MTNAEKYNFLAKYLYSAFPARMTTGIVVWMVNLAKGTEIIHGEGSTFGEAFDSAYQEFSK